MVNFIKNSMKVIGGCFVIWSGCVLLGFFVGVGFSVMRIL